MNTRWQKKNLFFPPILLGVLLLNIFFHGGTASPLSELNDILESALGPKVNLRGSDLSTTDAPHDAFSEEIAFFAEEVSSTDFLPPTMTTEGIMESSSALSISVACAAATVAGLLGFAAAFSVHRAMKEDCDDFDDQQDFENFDEAFYRRSDSFGKVFQIDSDEDDDDAEEVQANFHRSYSSCSTSSNEASLQDDMLFAACRGKSFVRSCRFEDMQTPEDKSLLGDNHDARATAAVATLPVGATTDPTNEEETAASPSRLKKKKQSNRPVFHTSKSMCVSRARFTPPAPPLPTVPRRDKRRHTCVAQRLPADTERLRLSSESTETSDFPITPPLRKKTYGGEHFRKGLKAEFTLNGLPHHYSPRTTHSSSLEDISTSFHELTTPCTDQKDRTALSLVRGAACCALDQSRRSSVRSFVEEKAVPDLNLDSIIQEAQNYWEQGSARNLTPN